MPGGKSTLAKTIVQIVSQIAVDILWIWRIGDMLFIDRELNRQILSQPLAWFALPLRPILGTGFPKYAIARRL
jgi:hypothetical protein